MKKTIAIIAAVIIVIAAGIGIYFGFFADRGSKTPGITATEDRLLLNDAMIDTYIANPERYRNALVNSYGLGEELTENFFAEPENWLAYDLIANLKNDSDRDLTAVGFVVEGADDDVFVSTNIGGELTLTPGAIYPISASVLINNGDLTTEQAKEKVDSVQIKVIYGAKESEDADLAETMLADIQRGN